MEIVDDNIVLSYIKESLLKELDYQFRLQEERDDEREQIRLESQEEHYRKVDELIRARNQKKTVAERRTQRRTERSDQAKNLEEMMQQKKAEKEEKKEREEEKKQQGEKIEKGMLGFLRKRRSIV